MACAAIIAIERYSRQCCARVATCAGNSGAAVRAVYHRGMHTTKDIAQRLDINPQTVRRWSDIYHAHISFSAFTADQRQYTDDDLLVLWSVRRWRQLGLSLDDIGDRLASGQRASEAPPEPPAGDRRRVEMVPAAVHSAALAELRQLEHERDRLLAERDSARVEAGKFADRIVELERAIGEARGRLQIVEAERQPAAYWLRWLAVAVVLALVLGAALALLVLLEALHARAGLKKPEKSQHSSTFARAHDRPKNAK